MYICVCTCGRFQLSVLQCVGIVPPSTPSTCVYIYVCVHVVCVNSVCCSVLVLCLHLYPQRV